jgi:hypothetical protein
LFILDQTSAEEFVRRFGLVSDGLLQEFNYRPVDKTVSVRIRIRDPELDYRWVLLSIELSDVREVFYDTRRYGANEIAVIKSIAVGSFDRSGSLIYYLDLAPESFDIVDEISRLRQLTEEDYQKSSLLISATNVSWSTSSL